jgi:phenylacetate-CoA ligase
MLSSIATLSDAFAETLQRKFGCPVLDLYALTEAGIVAVRTREGHAILPHDLYVEILDDEDQPCPEGVRGEIALTGGRNPFAPLLRYRTGDFASLVWRDGRPILQHLEGREPVVFATPEGGTVHSMQVSRALRQFALVQFSLHQDASGRFEFRYRGDVDAKAVSAELVSLLGRHAELSVAPLPHSSDRRRKIVQFHRA